MNQAVDVLAGVRAGPDAHLQGVEGPIGAQAARQLPADDAAGVDVDDEGGVDPAGEGAAVGDVGNPQLVRRGSGELPIDQVRAGVRSGAGHRGPRTLAAVNAAQPGGAHQAGDGAAGHRMALPVALGVDLVHPVDTEVLLVRLLDQGLGRRVADRPGRGRAGPGGVVAARGDLHASVLQHHADRLDPRSRPWAHRDNRRSLQSAVELRRGEKRRRGLEDLIRPTQLPVLPFQLGDPSRVIARGARPCRLAGASGPPPDSPTRPAGGGTQEKGAWRAAAREEGARDNALTHR
jgi:hypothetical protein